MALWRDGQLCVSCHVPDLSGRHPAGPGPRLAQVSLCSYGAGPAAWLLIAGGAASLRISARTGDPAHLLWAASLCFLGAFAHQGCKLTSSP